MPEKPTPFLSMRTAFWPVAGIIAAWVVLITQVRHHWGGESYYNFGWFVPFLSIWLILRNFSTIPAKPASDLRPHVIIGLLSLVFIIPFHALSEVNPFWRLPLWIQAVGICGFTLAAIHSMYGWKGVRYSLFPLFFLSTMIPWPYRFEVWIVQSLTGIVSGIAVSGLNFLGYPVELAGNSLVLGELSIGVNEACSGIRSLQALFMVTLFLGSLFGQSTWRRVAAIAVLPVIVIIVNSGRAIFLATQVIVNGDKAYSGWHDPAGYIAFGISMILIYACIELLNIGSPAERESQKIEPNFLLKQARLIPLGRLSPLFIVFPLLAFLVVEGWFRYHELVQPEKRGWVLNLPEDRPGFKSLEIPDEVSSLLGYSYGERFILSLPNRRGVEAYYYGYGQEDKLASVSSYGHSPAICMEAVGATMLEKFPDLMVRVENLVIPVQHYLFEGRNADYSFHVFWIVWEHRNMDISPEDLAGLNYRTQWIQLLKGRRNFSRQVLLANLVGEKNAQTARDEIRDLFSRWIEPRSD